MCLFVCVRGGHFNSQPHKEADIMRGELAVFYDISTHSLTRRLTCIRSYHSRRKIISTHSLTRRLTNILLGKLATLAFQLTASQGG